MDIPKITRECTVPLLETRFIKVYDLQYREGKHYYDATRRSRENIVAVKTEEEFKTMLPDAVSCFVILKKKSGEACLLLSYEFRYPAGRFLLSPPAGLVDPEDAGKPEPLKTAAVREIFEETGIRVKETDRVEVLDHFAFSTPGMTDESNALVTAVIELDDFSSLTQEGAEGSECFDGFELVTPEEAEKLLADGRDKFGHFYSIFTWCALMYFVSGRWKN